MSDNTPTARFDLAIKRVEEALNLADFDGCGHVITSDNMKLSDVRILVEHAKARTTTPANEAVVTEERWGLRFSNIPPFIEIRSAVPGHTPNKTIALCQFETVEDRNKQADQFRAIEAAHNLAMSRATLKPDVRGFTDWEHEPDEFDQQAEEAVGATPRVSDAEIDALGSQGGLSPCANQVSSPTGEAGASNLSSRKVPDDLRLELLLMKARRDADERADRIEELEAGLRPFADYADDRNVMPPDLPITNGSGMARRQLTMADCYKARALLSPAPRVSDDLRKLGPFNRENYRAALARIEELEAFVRKAKDWLMKDAGPSHINSEDVRVYHLEGGVLSNLLNEARALLSPPSAREDLSR